MNKNALVVFAKNPVAGLVKTRLGAEIGYADAAELYRAFLLDTLEKCSKVDAAIRLYLAPTAVAPHDALDRFDIHRLRQKGDGLGERMKRAIEESLAAGHERVVIIGSDHPTLPTRLIREAFSSLRKPDTMVIGPSADGGYYLLGLTALESTIFDDIVYSRGDVFDLTVARARSAQLSVVTLDPWYDVDTIEDVRILSRDLNGDGMDCPRTRRALLETGLIENTR